MLPLHPRLEQVAPVLQNKSAHFIERQRTRNIPDPLICLALAFGDCFYEGDERVYFLGRKQIARYQQTHAASGPSTERVPYFTDGVVVVVAATVEGDILVTTYRNAVYCRKLRRRFH